MEIVFRTCPQALKAHVIHCLRKALTMSIYPSHESMEVWTSSTIFWISSALLLQYYKSHAGSLDCALYVTTTTLHAAIAHISLHLQPYVMTIVKQ